MQRAAICMDGRVCLSPSCHALAESLPRRQEQDGTDEEQSQGDPVLNREDPAYPRYSSPGMTQDNCD